MIKIKAQLKGSLSNPDTDTIFLPAVPSVGELIQDYGGKRFEVKRVIWIPFNRDIDPDQARVELETEILPNQN